MHLSRRRVERFAYYRVVNQRSNDRKAFDDAKPRIRRDWTGLAPMERVVADVKHLDVIVRRADGFAEVLTTNGATATMTYGEIAAHGNIPATLPTVDPAELKPTVRPLRSAGLRI